MGSGGEKQELHRQDRKKGPPPIRFPGIKHGGLALPKPKKTLKSGKIARERTATLVLFFYVGAYIGADRKQKSAGKENNNERNDRIVNPGNLVRGQHRDGRSGREGLAGLQTAAGSPDPDRSEGGDGHSRRLPADSPRLRQARSCRSDCLLVQEAPFRRGDDPSTCRQGDTRTPAGVKRAIFYICIYEDIT